MIQRILTVTVVAALLVAAGARSAWANTCSGHTCTAELHELYVHATNGKTYVGTKANESSLTECTPEAGKHLVLQQSDPGADAIYKTLLTAFLSQQTVVIRVVNSNGACKIGYVKLYSN